MSISLYARSPLLPTHGARLAAQTRLVALSVRFRIRARRLLIGFPTVEFGFDCETNVGAINDSRSSVSVALRHCCGYNGVSGRK